MRMTRFEWLSQFFRLTAPKVNRAKSQREHRVVPLAQWHVRAHPHRVEGLKRMVLIGTVTARTKSEARAEAKKLIGLNHKQRLPIDTRVEEAPSC